ncbi:ABC transporter permease, partial [Streptomyces sp. NPDC059506]
TAGFARYDTPQVVAGAVLVAALALLVEGVLALAQRSADPLRRTRPTPVPSLPDNQTGR